MDSRVERIVPTNVQRVGRSTGKPGEQGRRRPFIIDAPAEEPPAPEESSTDPEGRNVSGPEDGEAGLRIDLSA